MYRLEDVVTLSPLNRVPSRRINIYFINEYIHC